MDTLFSGDNIEENGLFFSATNQRNTMSKKAIVTGGRISWIFNHVHSLGLAKYISNSFETNDKDTTKEDGDYTYKIDYSGLEYEYTFYPDSLIHHGFSLFMGTGKVFRFGDAETTYSSRVDDQDYTEVEKDLIAVKLGWQVELNLHLYVKLLLGLHYDWIQWDSFDLYRETGSSSEPTPVSEPTQKGPSFSTTLKIGTF